jgi:hypothetical protein
MSTAGGSSMSSSQESFEVQTGELNCGLKGSLIADWDVDSKSGSQRGLCTTRRGLEMSVVMNGFLIVNRVRDRSVNDKERRRLLSLNQVVNRDESRLWLEIMTF